MNETATETTIKPEELVVEPIVREVGERVMFINGRDYAEPSVRIVQSTYKDGQDHEKAVYISQRNNMGISLSLSTLEAIVDWAKGNL